MPRLVRTSPTPSSSTRLTDLIEKPRRPVGAQPSESRYPAMNERRCNSGKSSTQAGTRLRSAPVTKPLPSRRSHLVKTCQWQSLRPQWPSHIIASRTYYNGLYMADEIQELLALSNQNVKCFDDDCA